MKIFVNILTMIRIIATFVLPALWESLNPLDIIIIVMLIFITDFFDGKLARLFNVSTLFGKAMDAIADKLFGIAMLIIVAKYLPMFYIIAILELIIGLIILKAVLMGVNTKSSFLGKIKTWLIGISIVLGLIIIFKEDITIYSYFSFIEANNNLMILISVAITSIIDFLVLISYSKKIIKELKQNREIKKTKEKDSKGLWQKLFDTEYYNNNK